MSRARLFRWVGSKAHLVKSMTPRLRDQVMGGSGRMVSLFYGTGALEQAAAPGSPQVAAEANPDLRCLYRMLVRAPHSVATALSVLDAAHGRTREGFARVRALDAERLPPLERAARFLWLSAMSFNGLWRVNRDGQHNVPPDPARLARAFPFPSLKELTAAGRRLRSVEFLADWWQAAAEAAEGDVVISDPPYAGGFDSYTASGFGAEDQRELARTLRALVARGCAVIAFNSPQARDLYEALGRIEFVERSGRMSSAPERRGRVTEMVVLASLKAAAEKAA